MRRLLTILGVGRARMERDLERELRYHLDRAVEDLKARGVSDAEARRQAALEFGSVPRVREDVLKKKAVDAARQKASALAAAMKTGDFDAAAKSAGLEVKTTDLITRGTPVADIGTSAEVDTAAFSLPQGGVSDAITTDNGAVIVKVVEKKAVTDQELAAGRQALKDELLEAQRNRFYAAYMTKVRDRLRDRIEVNTQTLAQLLG